MTMGAGPVDHVGRQLLDALRRRESRPKSRTRRATTDRPELVSCSVGGGSEAREGAHGLV